MRACNAATPTSALSSDALKLKDASLSPAVEAPPTSSPIHFFVLRLPSEGYAVWARGWGGESPAHLGAHAVNRPEAKRWRGRTRNTTVIPKNGEDDDSTWAEMGR
jgi:hypothetical protein